MLHKRTMNCNERLLECREGSATWLPDRLVERRTFSPAASHWPLTRHFANVGRDHVSDEGLTLVAVETGKGSDVVLLFLKILLVWVWQQRARDGTTHAESSPSSTWMWLGDTMGFL